MNFLNHLKVDPVLSMPLPLQELLANSLFYPSCGFDGGVIKDCNTLRHSLGITSFIYCDYGISEEAFQFHQNSFAGYSVIGSRNLSISELIPNGWQQENPPSVEEKEYDQFRLNDITSFATWTIYERIAEETTSNKPKRFSLIYLSGEGVATYQALYWSNNEKPKAIAIIQPGTSFGCNWANFTNEDGPFGWVVKNNPTGIPKYIYNGGYGNDHPIEFWADFKLIDTIGNYYPLKKHHLPGLVNIFQLQQ
jgi:hypothetical protein